MGKKFDKLERKIERTERGEHPNYTSEHIKYIAKAAAGNVYREQQHPLSHVIGRKHHCDHCGITH